VQVLLGGLDLGVAEALMCLGEWMWLVAGRGLSRGRCPVAVDLERVRGGADQFPFAVDCC